MKHTIIAAAILATAFSAHAGDKAPKPPKEPPKIVDSWTGSDKSYHFFGSAIVGFAVGRIYPNEPLKAFGWAMVPGVLKEVSDIGGTGFSGKDLVWDAAGAALGVYAGGWSIRRFGDQTVVAYQTKF